MHWSCSATRFRNSAASDRGPLRIADRYELVLAFEYENINTNIEAMAKALKERRTDVRLGPMYYNQLIVL